MKWPFLIVFLSLAACADTAEGNHQGAKQLAEAEQTCMAQAGGRELYNVPGKSQALTQCKIAAVDTYGKEAYGIYQPFYQVELRKELMIASFLDNGKITQQDAIFVTGKVQSQLYTVVSAAKYQHMRQRQAEAEAVRAKIHSIGERLQTVADSYHDPAQAMQQSMPQTTIYTPQSASMNLPITYTTHRVGNTVIVNGSDGSSMSCFQTGSITNCN